MNSTTYAMVFPGQGSQKLGMLADYAEQYPQILTTFAEASEVLGYDCWQVCQADEAKLNQTEYTQPILLTASIALWRLWQEYCDTLPTIVAGHSLGEFTALVVAGSLTFTDAVQLVAKRGQYMQQAVPAGMGSMAAIIGLTDEVVANVCQESSTDDELVVPANYNSPGQVVISGNTKAVNRAVEMAKTTGAKRALPLPVSIPSHCALMAPAAEQLAKTLTDTLIIAPTIITLSNVDAKSHEDKKLIIKALTQQLAEPVRWVECVRNLAATKVETVIECGPGKVLTGLSRRIAPDLQAMNLATSSAFTETLATRGVKI